MRSSLHRTTVSLGATLVLLSSVLWSFSYPASAIKRLKLSTRSGGNVHGLDPAAVHSIYDVRAILMVYDTLFEYKALKRPFELKPNLAAEMPRLSADQKTYTIHLRKDAYFIDDACFPGGKGRQVHAQDVVYSILRMMDPATASGVGGELAPYIQGAEEWLKSARYEAPPAGLKALDTHTLQIKLNNPSAKFLHLLSQGTYAVIAREAVLKYQKDFARHPVGSGPFKLDNLDLSKAVFSANPNYRATKLDIYAEGYDPKLHGGYGLEKLHQNKIPLVDKLELHFVSDDNARLNAFLSADDLDTIALPNYLIPRIFEQNPLRLKAEYQAKFRFYQETGLAVSGILFNLKHPGIGYHSDPQENERRRVLRQAMLHAFDYKTYNRRFNLGMGRLLAGEIPPGIQTEVEPSSNPILESHYDLPRARKLLQEAGWSAQALPALHISTS
ncbi:MAG: ABC transporter substrate-binding protein [Zetaproteobacteria bacterium]|nr:ABC transporter substrate-binding protein [Zetaproteobacteria bacterium]